MNRKVKTIERMTAKIFDEAVNGFMAEDYVQVERITFSTGDDRFTAHIEYIDVRQ